MIIVIMFLQFSIEMPPLKRFKSICERMKFLSSQLILEATPGGILALKVETDLASVSTYFTNLKVEECPGMFYFGIKITMVWLLIN